jgi:hypothetical protein
MIGNKPEDRFSQIEYYIIKTALLLMLFITVLKMLWHEIALLFR